MPRKKTNPPAATSSPATERLLIADAFALLAQIGTALAAARIRALITILPTTDEIALNFDQPNGLKARELLPEMFPARKSKTGYAGETIYIKYETQSAKDARRALPVSFNFDFPGASGAATCATDPKKV